jgi:hypothetical protein
LFPRRAFGSAGIAQRPQAAPIGQSVQQHLTYLIGHRFETPTDTCRTSTSNSQRDGNHAPRDSEEVGVEEGGAARVSAGVGGPAARAA